MSIKKLTSKISQGIYRLRLAPSEHFEFSSFLLVDEKPCLVHAGKLSLFEPLLELVEELLGDKSLSYIVFSHVEGDESGAVNKWLERYKGAKLVCNKISNISLGDHLIRPAEVIRDSESIDLGEKKLMMIETPHFPHNWDAHMWFEKSKRVLFSSDFCCQGGVSSDQAESDESQSIIEFYEKGGFIPYGKSTMDALAKLSNVDFKIIAPMHGAVLLEKSASITFKKVRSDLEARA